MEILYWILIVAFFVLSFVGLIFPIIPSVLVLWGGFLIYQFLIASDELSLFFWISMVALTIFIFVVDFIANSHFVKKSGGSKWGERIAVIATIVGSFVFPPFGLIIVPFIAVFLVEFLQKKEAKASLKVAVGTIIGFLSSTLAKVFIQLGMISWFIIEEFI
jgi:uncharacterized protein YqgC (DUF456 family)